MSGSTEMTELKLLHEALAFRAKRVFDPAESVRLRGLLERVEDILLAPPDARPALRLSPPEQEVLVRQVLGYCAELTGRGASQLGREQAARLRQLVDRIAPGTLRKRPWWKFWG
ncbi:MAG: hypothetical protein IT349_08705 [Candidatus Eisenbacteria bacterium]|nr:hypothetical protein [Candidatus Eisenbacteria bacterium]MCC7142165.1 hypothetical protein [Candidatus Eisenbacteria bacterium]